MAPIAQTSPGGNDVGRYDGSRPRFESLQAWLEIYGEAEYAVYKKDHPATDLKYDEWATSVHAHGMYLWHAALDVWEEPSSSVRLQEAYIFPLSVDADVSRMTALK